MALIKCPECGRDISDKAESCPHCGYKVGQENRNYGYYPGGGANGTSVDNDMESEKNKESAKKFAFLSLAIGIFSTLFSCTGIGILGVLGLYFASKAIKKDKKVKYATLGIALCTFGITISALALITAGKGNEEEYKIDSNHEVRVLDDSEVTTATDEPVATAEPVSVKKQKIYDKHGTVIRVNSYDPSDNSLSLEIKNNSKKDYNFDVHSMSINGVMTNCNIYTGNTDVPSKKKGIMNVEFENEWLDGIDKIEYIDLIIWAYDDAKSFKDFETETIRIKTNYFKKENKFSAGKKAIKDSGLVIQKEKLDTETFVFSVINKNKNYVEFDFENSSINGWAFDDDYLFDAKSVCVYPNSKVSVKIDISDFSEKNNINKIKDVEFSLKVRPKGDYFKEKTTKKIKIK